MYQRSNARGDERRASLRERGTFMFFMAFLYAGFSLLLFAGVKIPELTDQGKWE
jgi:hypothetical protein